MAQKSWALQPHLSLESPPITLPLRAQAHPVPETPGTLTGATQEARQWAARPALWYPGTASALGMEPIPRAHGPAGRRTLVSPRGSVAVPEPQPSDFSPMFHLPSMLAAPLSQFGGQCPCVTKVLVMGVCGAMARDLCLGLIVTVHPGLHAHLHSHHNTSVPTRPGSRLEITQTQCFSNKPKLLDQHGAGSAPWPDCRPCFLPHTLGRGHPACSSPGCHLFTRSSPPVLGLILEVPSCGVPSCRLSILETEMAFLHMEFSENHQLLSLTGGWAWPGGCPCTFGKPCYCEGWGSAPTGAQLSPPCRPLPPGGHPQPVSLTPDHYHCSCFRHSSGPDGVPLHRAHGRRHCGSWCTCSLDHKARMVEPGPVGFQKQGEALTFSAPHPHL